MLTSPILLSAYLPHSFAHTPPLVKLKQMNKMFFHFTEYGLLSVITLETVWGAHLLLTVIYSSFFPQRISHLGNI